MSAHQIFLGYACQDISPLQPHALSGYADDATRPCLGMLDPVYGTCLAISDADGNTVLLYSMDLCLVNTKTVSALRAAVSARTGIREDHIHFAATHTHAGPSLNAALPGTALYIDQLAAQMTQAAEAALLDRCSTDICIGTANTAGLNFVRHYKTAAGTYMGDNFGDKTLPLVGHASDADPQIQLVRFVRQGKQDVILVNWQAHGKMSSTVNSEFGRTHRNHLSADFIGYARNHLQEKTGAAVIYFSGAAGNLNPDSRIPAEAPTKDPAEFGKLLAEAAMAGLESMQPVSGGPVRCSMRLATATVDHSDDEKLEIAQHIWALWSQDQEKSRALAAKYGFNSPYAARDVATRYHAGTNMQMELNTVTVGDLAFVAAPYEMFCENGKFIKEHAPFPMTVIMSCANNYFSYLASERAFGHGGYEVDSRRFVKGTAEQMAQTLLDMLKDG